MFADLNGALGFSDSAPPAGLLILGTDTLEADGNFLIHHFIGLHLKGCHNVCLVAFAQIFHHYLAVSKKLGFNLQKSQEIGAFVFIDCLTDLPINNDSQFTHTAPKNAQELSSLLSLL
eukprot:Colp12_sorted_trinity150504_noHs@36286